jgi:hypothetical protein
MAHLTKKAKLEPVLLIMGTRWQALHPLGTPSDLFLSRIEDAPCDERTGLPIPVVLLIPGYLPPRGRGYHFLDRASPLLSFFGGSF